MNLRQLVAVSLCLASLICVGQKEITVQIRSYDLRSNPVSDVTFEVYNGTDPAHVEHSEDGNFSFIIRTNDEPITLLAKAQDYQTKELQFPVPSYFFGSKFSLQEIDLEFRPGSEIEIESGQLTYKTGKYFIERSPSKIEEILAEQEQLAESSEASEDPAVNPDLIELNEFQAPPASDTPIPETTRSLSPDEDRTFSSNSKYFSVQVGAFSKQVERSYFKRVPEFKVINDASYFRCYSGQFTDKDEAYMRRELLVDIGFIDSFVVEFQGGERVEF